MVTHCKANPLDVESCRALQCSWWLTNSINRSWERWPVLHSPTPRYGRITNELLGKMSDHQLALLLHWIGLSQSSFLHHIMNIANLVWVLNYCMCFVPSWSYWNTPLGLQCVMGCVSYAHRVCQPINYPMATRRNQN